MAESIIVTGCDANHHALAADLLASIAAQGRRDYALGFVNIGRHPLPAEIADHVDAIVDVPDEGFEAAGGNGFRLGFLNVKPRLPILFPGFHRYAWMDADTRVQNGAGLTDLLRCADLAPIALAPESDPNYAAAESPSRWALTLYRGLLGEAAMHAYGRLPMLNSGVFSATAASPVWAPWSAALARLRTSPPSDADTVFSDQIPLHFLIHSTRLGFHPLRAVNNWLVSISPPGFDLATRLLRAPTWPHEEINIIHLAGEAKHQTVVLDGRDLGLTYRYRDIRTYRESLS